MSLMRLLSGRAPPMGKTKAAFERQSGKEELAVGSDLSQMHESEVTAVNRCPDLTPTIPPTHVDHPPYFISKTLHV